MQLLLSSDAVLVNAKLIVTAIKVMAARIISTYGFILADDSPHRLSICASRGGGSGVDLSVIIVASV